MDLSTPSPRVERARVQAMLGEMLALCQASVESLGLSDSPVADLSFELADLLGMFARLDPQDATADRHEFCLRAVAFEKWLEYKTAYDAGRSQGMLLARESSFLHRSAPLGSQLLADSAQALGLANALGRIGEDAATLIQTLCALDSALSLASADFDLGPDCDELLENPGALFAPLRPACDALGQIAASSMPAAFFFDFAKQLPRLAPEQPYGATPFAMRVIASCLPANWFLLAALAANPTLARVRDEQGRSVLSHFNQALCLQDVSLETLGWTRASYALSEACACDMLDLAGDPILLVERPDPFAMAATPALRRRAERWAIASESFPAASRPQATL